MRGPLIPPAHEKTVSSWACAEANTHVCNGIVPLLPSLGGPLPCGCWCHLRVPAVASLDG